MTKLTEEQKTLLCCYKGGRYKVLREIRQGIEVLKEDGDEDGMIEDLEILASFLESCTNKAFFQMKNEALLDQEMEGEANAVQGTDN